MTNLGGITSPFAVLTTYEVDEPTPVAPLAERALDLARTYGPRHAGFLSARVYIGEERMSFAVLTEWTSREEFEAFRQSAHGQEVVAEGVVFHPKIRFLVLAGAVEFG